MTLFPKEIKYESWEGIQVNPITELNMALLLHSPEFNHVGPYLEELFNIMKPQSPHL